MRKLLPLLLAALLLTGCAAPTPVSEDGKLRIVTTIWPEYQWVRAILGENPAGAEVELLVADGVDPHSFQPAVQDILQLYTCDLLIYLGAESDRWVQDTLQGEVDEALVALALMDAVAEDLCTAEHDHDHGAADHRADDYREEDVHRGRGRELHRPRRCAAGMGFRHPFPARHETARLVLRGRHQHLRGRRRGGWRSRLRLDH